MIDPLGMAGTLFRDFPDLHGITWLVIVGHRTRVVVVTALLLCVSFCCFSSILYPISNAQNLGVSSTDRTILKRKIKDLKATAEKEKKAAEKERKEAEKKAKKEGGPTSGSTRRKFFA